VGTVEQPKTYEQVLEMMMSLSEEEMQARLAEARDICICADCPSYANTGETELPFCGLGKKGAPDPRILDSDASGLSMLYALAIDLPVHRHKWASCSIHMSAEMPRR